MGMIKSNEAAERLGITTQTLYKMRREGRGPKGWRKVGYNLVLYPEESIDAWLFGEQEPAAEGETDTGHLKARIHTYLSRAGKPREMADIRRFLTPEVAPIDRKNALDDLVRAGKIKVETLRRGDEIVAFYTAL